MYGTLECSRRIFTEREKVAGECGQNRNCIYEGACPFLYFKEAKHLGKFEIYLGTAEDIGAYGNLCRSADKVFEYVGEVLELHGFVNTFENGICIIAKKEGELVGAVLADCSSPGVLFIQSVIVADCTADEAAEAVSAVMNRLGQEAARRGYSEILLHGGAATAAEYQMFAEAGYEGFAHNGVMYYTFRLAS